MADGIESSADLKREMEELELNAAGAVEMPDTPEAVKRGIPPWVKYMIIADVITILVVLVVVLFVI